MSSIDAKHREDSNAASSTIAGRFVSRLFVWLGTLTWRAQVDWSARRSLLTRATAHISIVVLALVALLLGGLEPVRQAVIASVAPIEAEPEPTPTLVPIAPEAGWPQASSLVDRLALPHTTIPERPRSSVITYTVQPGDTVFGIAEMFGLSAHTIYWANSEVLHDNPHMLWPDMVLNILPVDGVYHVVEAGETIDSILSEYSVSPSIVYNEWNSLERDQALRAGQGLVIPGGTREFLVWQLPRYSDLQGSASIGAGICPLPSIGLRGNGWLVWPTGSRRVSGWVFHDSRNPPHGGVDIGLATGDPIYAADNGIVAYAGWNDWGYGYLVVIDHGNNFQTYYAHLSSIWVVCGQSVYQGAAIAGGGSTGRSSGPHLHFEVRYEGVPQDPVYYLP